MSLNQNDAMDLRITCLERTIRRFKIVSVLACLLAFVSVAAGAMMAAPGTTTSSVTIVDGENNPRIRLGFNPQDGASYINFFDGNRTLRLNIWAVPNGQGFMYEDANGNQKRLY